MPIRNGSLDTWLHCLEQPSEQADVSINSSRGRRTPSATLLGRLSSRRRSPSAHRSRPSLRSLLLLPLIWPWQETTEQDFECSRRRRSRINTHPHHAFTVGT